MFQISWKQSRFSYNKKWKDLILSAIGALCIVIRLQRLLSQEAVFNKAIVHHLKLGVNITFAAYAFYPFLQDSRMATKRASRTIQTIIP